MKTTSESTPMNCDECKAKFVQEIRGELAKKFYGMVKFHHEMPNEPFVILTSRQLEEFWDGG